MNKMNERSITKLQFVRFVFHFMFASWKRELALMTWKRFGYVMVAAFAYISCILLSLCLACFVWHGLVIWSLLAIILNILYIAMFMDCMRTARGFVPPKTPLELMTIECDSRYTQHEVDIWLDKCCEGGELTLFESTAQYRAGQKVILEKIRHHRADPNLSDPHLSDPLKGAPLH